jgi:hypothetical protein
MLPLEEELDAPVESAPPLHARTVSVARAVDAATATVRPRAFAFRLARTGLSFGGGLGRRGLLMEKA